jgi:hypothetical protein
MSPMTTALIDYWQRLPAQSAAARRQQLASVCERVRTGAAAPETLVTFALGDVDEFIVREATAAYLETSAAGGAKCRNRALEGAVEWVRRGLAFNRGAVFAAVLSTGSDAAVEQLASQRLTLSPEETAALFRQLPAPLPGATVRFLTEWIELLEGASDLRLHRQHELVAAAIARLTATASPRIAA